MAVTGALSATFLPTIIVIASITDDPDRMSLLGKFFITAAFLILGVAIAISSWWPHRHAYADFDGNKKAIVTTTIQRLQKVGFFEMQADSALGIMAGAIYYLWIPDETRTPPQRRFRIGLTTYRQLMLYGNGPIVVSYLPKSGIILSIDTPDYRYAAWESPDKRHQHKSSPLARN